MIAYLSSMGSPQASPGDRVVVHIHPLSWLVWVISRHMAELRP